MARRRVRASRWKDEDRDAQTIGSGVYSIVRDLQGQNRQLPFPVHVTAPLIYVSEMIAVGACKRDPLLRDRHDDVARYTMAALSEITVALVAALDVEHLEEWIAAAERQEERASG